MPPDPDQSQDRPFRPRNPDHRRGFKIRREETAPRVYDLPCRRTINVRLRYGGRIMTYDCGDLAVDIGDWVVIKDLEVLRMGLVTSKPIIWPSDQEKRKVMLPSDRRLLRVANEGDLARQAENQLREREAYEYCQGCVAHQNLMMKLVAAEVTFDNFKTIFYYTSEDRVDFRSLVKELVTRLRTRVEMRQIGVRNEALMLGGMGICGRPFCCAGFLSSFSPVSVRMAKDQNISLNTSKLSGVCGRLMCCLAFENYNEPGAGAQPEDPDAPRADFEEPAAAPTGRQQSASRQWAEAPSRSPGFDGRSQREGRRGRFSSPGPDENRGRWPDRGRAAEDALSPPSSEPPAPPSERGSSIAAEGALVRPAVADGAGVPPPAVDGARVPPASADGARVPPAPADGARVRPAAADGAPLRPTAPDGARVPLAAADWAHVRPAAPVPPDVPTAFPHPGETPLEDAEAAAPPATPPTVDAALEPLDAAAGAPPEQPVAPPELAAPPEPATPTAVAAPSELAAPEAVESVVIALTRFHQPTQWSQALSRFLLETGPDTWPDSEAPGEETMALSDKARSFIRGSAANPQRPSPFPGRQATVPFVEDGEFLERDAPEEETMAAALASLAEATERAWSTCDSVVKNIQPALTCSDLRFGREFVFEDDEEGETADELEKTEEGQKAEDADETAAASPLASDGAQAADAAPAAESAPLVSDASPLVSDAAPAAESAPLAGEGAPAAEGPTPASPPPDRPLEASSPEGSNPAPPSPSGLVSEGAPVAEGPPQASPPPDQPLEASSPDGSNPAPPSPSGLVSEGAPVAEGPPTAPRDPVS